MNFSLKIQSTFKILYLTKILILILSSMMSLPSNIIIYRKIQSFMKARKSFKLNGLMKKIRGSLEFPQFENKGKIQMLLQKKKVGLIVFLKKENHLN